MSLDSGGAALLQVNVQAVIVEYLIKNVHVFFDEKAAAAAIVANPRYSSGSWERQQKIVADSGKMFVALNCLIYRVNDTFDMHGNLF